MNKEEKIIEKLNTLTQDNILKWKDNYLDFKSKSGDEIIIGKSYVCEYKNQYYRIYKYQVKSYYDETLYQWIDGIRLEIIDSMGYSLWTFTTPRDLYQLYQSIQYKAEKIENIFNELLQDKE